MTINTIDNLYENFQVPLTKYIFRLCGNWSLAEDVVSDVFLALLNGKKPNQNVKAYLFTSAYNRFVIYYRKSLRCVSLNEHIGSDKDVTANTAELNVLMSEIYQALQYLSVNKRHAIVLKMEGIDVSESAKLLKTKKENVRNLQSRAAKDVQKSMNRTDVCTLCGGSGSFIDGYGNPVERCKCNPPKHHRSVKSS